MPSTTTQTKHPAANLLNQGRIERGAKLRIRIAHSSKGLVEYRKDEIELCLNDKHFIRLSMPDLAADGLERIDYSYELSCSRSFLGSDEMEDQIDKVAKFHQSGAKFDLSNLEASDANTGDFAKNCVGVILAAFKHFLSGFFRINAVRDQQDVSSSEPSTFDLPVEKLIAELNKTPEERVNERHGRVPEDLIQRIREQLNSLVLDERVKHRYVGPNGESAFGLWRKFSENAMVDRDVPAGYRLSEYLSFWLYKLLGIKIEDRIDQTGDLTKTPQKKSICGFLRDQMHAPPAAPDIQFPQGCEQPRLERFVHPCFNSYLPQGPARLSAGFHQLFPILMQAALLQRHEIMAIENPEVHLHPSLQLAIAEHLMHQANGGKTILVETHSDLIIRRLIRAVLEEDIKQESLNIQFASLVTPEDSKEEYSRLEPLSVNKDTGRINNWPSGFLDDDIKESRRLFEIMYGAVPEDDGEDY